MKTLFITGIIAASSLLTGCGKSGAGGSSTSLTLITADTPLKELVTQSPIIVFARADTNNLPTIHFTVAEIWKGSRDASAAGCAVGTQLSRQWPANGGALPDGAVLFYQQGAASSDTFRVASEYMVRAGHIGGMTIQEFKTTLL